MKNLLITYLIFVSYTAFGLSSPFPSSVEAISIPNTHFVDKEERILRGQAPHGLIQELMAQDITDILIFKNQTKVENETEKDEILSLAGKSIQVYEIPFLWKDFPSYKVACEQVVDALRILRSVKNNPKRKIFFHCTVGEDRTGLLAGIWRMLNESYSTTEAFTTEMCENGYAHGNPNKPWTVYGAIRKSLTPLFQFLSAKIESGELSLNHLTKKICTDDIQTENMTMMKCKKSSKFPVKD